MHLISPVPEVPGDPVPAQSDPLSFERLREEVIAAVNEPAFIDGLAHAVGFRLYGWAMPSKPVKPKKSPSAVIKSPEACLAVYTRLGMESRLLLKEARTVGLERFYEVLPRTAAALRKDRVNPATTAALLNHFEVPTRRGKMWTTKQVTRVLERWDQTQKPKAGMGGAA